MGRDSLRRAPGRGHIHETLGLGSPAAYVAARIVPGVRTSLHRSSTGAREGDGIQGLRTLPALRGTFPHEHDGEAPMASAHRRRLSWTSASAAPSVSHGTVALLPGRTMDRPSSSRPDRSLQLGGDGLADVFDLAPSFLAVLEGPEHVFVHVNAAYHRLVGERELMGVPVREALPEVIDQGFVLPFV